MKSETYKEKSGIQRLRENLKGLTFEQKIEHIFSYYWGTILLVILVPVFLGIILASVFKERPDVTFSGNCCNVTLTDEGISYLINDWNSVLNMEPGTLELNLDFVTTAGLDGGYDIDSGLKIVAEVAADSLDYVLCDGVGMEYLAVQRAFLPVDQILDQDTFAKWSEKIYYFTDEEEGTTYAAGIDISDMPFIQTCVPEEGPIYFMFANREEPNVERLQMFLSHISAWGEE